MRRANGAQYTTTKMVSEVANGSPIIVVGANIVYR